MSFEINFQKKAQKKISPPKTHKLFKQDDDDEDTKIQSKLKSSMPYLVNEISRANEEKVYFL
jgi:hypothetical protein